MMQSIRHRLQSTEVLALSLLLLAMLWLSRDYGVTYDELAQQEYGQHVYEFFASGFKNRDAFTYVNLYLYGGLFDGLAVLAQKKLLWMDLYDVRHLLNALVGWIGYVYVFRLGSAIGGRVTGWLSLALLLISPMYFGQIANNPKDIPFASFYVASVYYIILVLRECPRPSIKTLSKLVAAIALAINMRVGGILLICYFEMALGLFVLHEIWQVKRFDLPKLKRVLLAAAICPLLIVPLGTIGWPWAQWQPLIRPFIALTQMSRFGDWNGILRFNGRLIEAINVPWTYVPVWFAATTPFIAMFGLVLGLLELRHSNRRWEIMLLVFTAVFPVAYVIAKHSVLYNGVRHFLFTYPPLVVVAAYGLTHTIQIAVSRSGTPQLIKIGACILLAMSAYDPVAFSVRNHPNEVVYFNPSVGGATGAYKRFDLDYWGNCQKQAMRWLSETSKQNQSEIKVTLEGITHVPQLEKQGGHFQFLSKNERGDYRLIALHDVSPERLNELDLSTEIVYKVTTDGAPLCLVLTETPTKY